MIDDLTTSQVLGTFFYTLVVFVIGALPVQVLRRSVDLTWNKD